MPKRGFGDGPSTSTHDTHSQAGATSSSLDALVTVAKEKLRGRATAGGPLDPSTLHQLGALVGQITAAELGGLAPGSSVWRRCFSPQHALRDTPRIAALPVYEAADFHMTCFLLPKGSAIPLHNHPGMTVFSKLLFGKIKVRSYDLVSTTTNRGSTVAAAPIQAALVADIVVEAGQPTASPETQTVQPNHGNLHSISALEDSAFFDLLTPPYSQPSRPCSYFREKTQLPTNDQHNLSLVLLEPIPEPFF
ncbi:DNA damage-binding protein 1a [Balamuthia mandrillaris]